MNFRRVNKVESMAVCQSVAAEIRRTIAVGEVTEGERLPPSVDLAAIVDVNKNMVVAHSMLCATRGCSISPGDAGFGWRERLNSARSFRRPTTP